MLTDQEAAPRRKRKFAPLAAGVAILSFIPAGALLLPLHAAPAGSAFVVNAATTGHQDAAAVAADESDGFIVVWEGPDAGGYGRDIFMRRFDSIGYPASASEARVNTYTKGNQSRPSVASDRKGGFVVVWAGEGAEESQGIFGQLFDGSVPKGSEFHVNTYTLSDQSRPEVAMNSAGEFTVIWESFGQDGSYTGVFGQHFDSSGAKTGVEFRVNVNTGDRQGAADVGRADSPASKFVVAWTSGNSDEDPNGTIQPCDPNPRDASGSGVFKRALYTAAPGDANDVQVNCFTAGFQGYPRLSMGEAGDFIVVWQSGRSAKGPDGSGGGISGRHFDFNGVPVEEEIQVNAYTMGLQAWPDVAMDPDGEGFVVVWRGWGEAGDGIFARRFKTKSDPLGCKEFPLHLPTPPLASSPALPPPSSLHPSLLPPPPPLSPPRVALTGECSFVTVWTSGDETHNGEDGLAGGIVARLFPELGATCAAADRAYCCPAPDYRGSPPPDVPFECPVRWAGITGAPSIDCPQSLCSMSYAAGDFNAMLNERHRRAGGIWYESAAIIPTTAPASGRHVVIPDTDKNPNHGLPGDVRVDAFTSEASACLNPDGSEIMVCSASECRNHQECLLSLGSSCFIPDGAPPGTKGKCGCSGNGACVASLGGAHLGGADLGKCVHAYQVLGNGCISRELRDTWVCADCQWHQAAGALDCDELVTDTNKVPLCPPRDPSRSDPRGILAVSANRVLTQSWNRVSGQSGKAVIGSPTYPWLLVPDPQDDCGPCDFDGCLNDEHTLAHEMGHVFSLRHSDPDYTHSSISRAYLAGVGSGLCQYQGIKTLAGEVVEDRVEYFLERIGDGVPEFPYLDIEKARFWLGKNGKDHESGGRTLGISIGLAGLLPPWRGPLTSLILLDTDGNPATGCKSTRLSSRTNCLMKGADRAIVVVVEYVEAACKEEWPQFSARSFALGLDSERKLTRPLGEGSEALDARAQIVYLERRGRASGETGPDQLPIRSEIQVMIERPGETLELPPGWDKFPRGWRVMAITKGPDGQLVDRAPDTPATLWFARRGGPAQKK